MKDKKTKQHYTAPEVTVVSFVAERGFTGSTPAPIPMEFDQAERQDYIFESGNNQTWGVSQS